MRVKGVKGGKQGVFLAICRGITPTAPAL